LAKLQYDLSAAHYKAVMESVSSHKIKDYFWIVQETSAPYAVMVYRAKPELIEGAMIFRDLLLNRVVGAIRSQKFPSYPTDIVDIDLPPWAVEEQARMGIEVEDAS
jgi:PDDEXK-like domain of unknown function (DUF3799)